MKKKIILIEDCPSTGELIKVLLEEKGFEVVWLKTFDTALEYLNALEIDDSLVAIIFDYGLDKNRLSINSIPLVNIPEEKGYTGLLIANSSENYYNELLKNAGCNHIRRVPSYDRNGSPPPNILVA